MRGYDERPWAEHYPPAVPATWEPPLVGALDLWRAAVARSAGRPAIRYFHQTLTFGDIDSQSDALAAHLQAIGLQPGDRLAICLQNDPQWVIGLLATWKVGAIVVPLNPMFRHREWAFHLNDARPRVLLCLEDIYRATASAVVGASTVERVVTTTPLDLLPAGSFAPTVPTSGPGDAPRPAGIEDLGEILERRAGECPTDVAPSADDVALLTYTSGTTGPPKGAMNTSAAIAYNAQLFAAWHELDDSDTILGLSPLFHITGLVLHMALSWSATAPLVLFHRFDAGAALALAEHWRATTSVAAITAYVALLDHPDITSRNLSALHVVASGGAPVSPAVVDRFRIATGVTIRNVYGLTETTSPSHLTPPAAEPPIDPGTGALSVGIPVPAADVHVVDLETGEDVPIGEVGEIVVSGPMVVPGYWNQPKASAFAFRGGRLHTGDVGFMTTDGWFFVIDRAKDVINASGFKVWPREVEDVMLQHEAVREVAVIGVPDDYRGETVKAFVAFRAGRHAAREELLAFCRDRLAAYKRPHLLEIVDELPKTLTGKTLRRDLRARHDEVNRRDIELTEAPEAPGSNIGPAN